MTKIIRLKNVKILKCSTECDFHWSKLPKFIEKMRTSILDLSGVDLSNANLSGADLSKADLNDANLNNANLSGADLGALICVMLI